MNTAIITSNIQQRRVVGSLMESFEASFGDVSFDENRVYGYSSNLAGDIVIDLTGADTSKIVLIYHKDYQAPLFTGASVVESGVYVEGVLNIIRLSYNGSNVIVAYHAQI